MKKAPAMLLVISLLPACNLQNDKTVSTVSESSAEKLKEHEEKYEELVLNTGVKWKADSAILLNVALLKSIIFGVGKESVENYI